MISVLLLNLVISYFFFEDRRDKAKAHTKVHEQKIIHKNNSKKILYSLLALFPGQLVFFISDTCFEGFTSNAGLFSALGCGSLIGVIIGMFYRKLPHLSLLTFCFGIGVLLSGVPLITKFFSPNLLIDIPYQLMLFSSLGGFYLPFFFDVILSSTSADFRGTACGFIDLVIALASIIGVLIVIVFNPGEVLVLGMTVVLFIIAMTLQKRGERHA